MPTVAITGWTKGCNTIVAIKEIREKALLPLDKALAAVNRVLNNEKVMLAVSSPADAQALANALSGQGLIATSTCDQECDTIGTRRQRHRKQVSEEIGL
jgi:hypothetical protein